MTVEEFTNADTDAPASEQLTDIIYGPPRAPRIAKNQIFLYGGPYIKKTGSYCFPLLYVCSVMRSYCPENFFHLSLT